MISNSFVETEAAHHLPENSHRGPLERTLPRFSVGRSPYDQPARTTTARCIRRPVQRLARFV